MYTAFASVYDRLMADVDYPAWAAFYLKILKEYGISQGKVCECACGTGSLTIALSSMGYQMTGADISPDMLFEASQKARKRGAMIPFVRQDMRSLRLHRQMDAVLCTCDGLNYLRDEKEVGAFFQAALAALRPGGALAFDLSTPYKLQHVLGDNIICDETAELAYLWKNLYHPSKGCVEMALSIFVRQQGESYLRISEQQTQYAHDLPMLDRLLQQCGYTDIRCYGDRRMEAPAPQEKRWHIAARKLEPPPEASENA